MRLYAGSSTNFINLNRKNQIAELLREEFMKQFEYNPSQSEVMSWRNSLMRLSMLFEDAELTDHGVFVEYKLPLSSKRIDVMVCGKDEEDTKNAVIIELKQWEKTRLTDIDSDYIVTWVGGGNRNILHPSVQVGNYKYYLQENNTAFYRADDPIQLHACSYLHNYNFYNQDAIFDERFQDAIERFPVYTADDTSELASYLSNTLEKGDGMEILSDIENSKVRPSKKLLKEISGNIKDKLKGDLKIFSNVKTKSDYILLDEQLVVYDTVMSIIRKGLADKQKYAIIVKGGAGTGKSVIALQLLADLAAVGKNAHYATGSKSFTQTLRKIVGSNSSSIFKYFMSYGFVEPNSLDVLIMDEAHRIREKTGFPHKSTGREQVVDLMRAAKVSVFFIDDYQGVRAGEIGQSDYIRDRAERMNCKVFDYELEGQFRCGGAEGYINWIDNTLKIKRTPNVLWKNDEQFEFRIMNSPEELENAIRRKQSEGFSARMMAGFCWPWSNKTDEYGELIDDVQIGDFKRPWNARENLKGLSRRIPKSQFWAYDPNGIDQVGCIYTAQGFEFDYAGVIFGTDLVYNPETGQWEGHPEKSHDTQVKKSKENFTKLVKQTYRVLLTRGIKGCFVYFMDKETEKFFRSRMEQ